MGRFESTYDGRKNGDLPPQETLQEDDQCQNCRFYILDFCTQLGEDVDPYARCPQHEPIRSGEETR